MLNIYNTYKELIIESSELLVEAYKGDHVVYGTPTTNDIHRAIDSNYRYTIWYQGAKETVPTARKCDVYALGKKADKSGMVRDVIRVYQASGYSTTQKPFGHGWKTFYVDRISRMEETGQHVGLKPISDYGFDVGGKFNHSGDRWMDSVTYIKKFGTADKEEISYDEK